jgi:monoamine oxidase
MASDYLFDRAGTPAMLRTRRWLIARAAEVGGAGAAFLAMQALGISAPTEPSPLRPYSIRSHGRRRQVIILGAGIAGLTAAIELERAGFSCVLVEARQRPGGRNWTVRAGSRVDLTDGSRQRCQWDDGQYFNAGPARIPSMHRHVLGYCRRLGVILEPELNVSRSALMQADGLNGGAPVEQRRVMNDTRGILSELLAKAIDTHRLDDVLSVDEAHGTLEFLRQYGDLSANFRYLGSDRAGYEIPPGAGDQAAKTHKPLVWRELLAADFTKGELYEERINWQATMLQPVGGMDRLAYAMAKAVHGPILYQHEVVELRQSDGAVAVTCSADNASRTITAEFCVNTLPVSIMRTMPNNLSKEKKAAFRQINVDPWFKVAWQSPRFWETNYDIYGGLSFQKQVVDVIWYPSNALFSKTGILISGFNTEVDVDSGEPTAFGRLGTTPEKLDASREAVERMHPGCSRLLEKPMFVPWGRVPYSLGGVANNHAESAQPAYRELNTPADRIVFAGDYLSHLTGWQEGAILSAHNAVEYVFRRSAERAAPATMGTLDATVERVA